MKQHVRLLTGILSLAMLTLAGCTNPKTDDYINLSRLSGTLAAQGGTPLTVQIEASQSWSAQPDASWLTADKTDETTLTISAADNTEPNEREAIVTVTAGNAIAYITINQLGYEANIHYRELTRFQYDAAISPSGTYAGGFIYSVDEMSNGFFQPVIIETATDNWHYLETYPQSLYDLTTTSAITDDGKLFINNNNGGGNVIFSVSEEPIVPDASAAGFTTLPTITATAADATTWVGYSQGDDGMYYPLVWRNGVAEKLPWPEKNFRDEAFLNGIIARGISADGSVIYGSTWDNYDFGMVYWKNGEVKYVGEDVHEVTPITVETVVGPVETHMANGMTATAELYKVSPNGEWIAGTYRTEAATGDGGAPVTSGYTAAFYNTVEEKTYLIEGFATAIGVTNDGIGFVSKTNIALTSCNVYDIKNGIDMGNINDWVLQNYGYILPQETYAQFASADGHVLFGRINFGGDQWRSWFLYSNEE